MKTIRSAEADRSSSCGFSDYIAEISVEFFKRQCPQDLLGNYEQTVLATFVVQWLPMEKERSNGLLAVVSLGVGTKVASAASIKSNHRHFGNTIVRDCHAEVLARRGFMRYLYDQVELAKDSELSNVDMSNHCIFEKGLEGRLVLKKGVRIHLYTSSQPCGNASIKRWAKSQQPRFQAELPIYKYPEDIHKRIQITNESRAEGQVALLVKRNNHTAKDVMPEEDTKKQKKTPTSSLHIPVGTAAVDSGEGNVMTCSDKIARWNALGVQGALLSAIMHPVYLSTVTVGRKFSKVHCERALCCRLQDFQYPPGKLCGVSGGKQRKKQKVAEKAPSADGSVNDTHLLAATSTSSGLFAVETSTEANREGSPQPQPPVFKIHHPVMLGTKVKLDQGVICTGPPVVGITAQAVTSVVDSVTIGSTSTSACNEVAVDGVSSGSHVYSYSDLDVRIQSPEKAERAVERAVAGARFSEPRCLLVYQLAQRAPCKQLAATSTVAQAREIINYVDTQLGSHQSADVVPAAASAGEYVIEVMDGRTGLLVPPTTASAKAVDINTQCDLVSSVCSAELAKIFKLVNWPGSDGSDAVTPQDTSSQRVECYKAFKIITAPEYANAKLHLISEPLLFAQWIKK